MKNILIINGHPDKSSFYFALAESYKKGADTNGDDCQLVNLIDLKFNPILNFGYRIVMEFEPDLLKIQQEILRRPFSYCISHLVGNLSCLVKRIY